MGLSVHVPEEYIQKGKFGVNISTSHCHHILHKKCVSASNSMDMDTLSERLF